MENPLNGANAPPKWRDTETVISPARKAAIVVAFVYAIVFYATFSLPDTWWMAAWVFLGATPFYGVGLCLLCGNALGRMASIVVFAIAVWISSAAYQLRGLPLNSPDAPLASGAAHCP